MAAAPAKSEPITRRTAQNGTDSDSPDRSPVSVSSGPRAAGVSDSTGTVAGDGVVGFGDRGDFDGFLVGLGDADSVGLGVLVGLAAVVDVGLGDGFEVLP